MVEITSILQTLEGSEVTHIFTHHVTALIHRYALEEFLPGCDHYDQRALILARADDIVCVAGTVDRRYVHYLSGLGLGPRGDHIIELGIESGDDSGRTLADMLLERETPLRVVCQLIPANTRVVLNPYLLSSVELDLATVLANMLGKPVRVLGGNAEIIMHGNLKHLAQAKAEELAIPTAPGEIVDLHSHSDSGHLDVSLLLKAIARFIPYTGRVIVRGTCGAAGSGTFIAEGPCQDIKMKLKVFVEKQVHHIYLVQVMFDIIATPNVLMSVEPYTDAIWWVGATDQRVNKNLAHKGNVFPSNARTISDMICSARKLSRWLQMEGFTGLVGFDFVEYVHPETSEHTYLFAEMNVRVNAATYPIFLMEHLNVRQAGRSAPFVKAFLSAKTTTKATSFSEFLEMYRCLFFDPYTGRGMIPYNTGQLVNGMCDLVFVGGSRQDVEDMYQRFLETHAQLEIPLPYRET